MFIVAFIFFLSIPDIDILKILSEYKSLSAKMDNIEAASSILKSKQDELSYFVLLLKFIATIFLYVAMLTASYLFYAQKKAHESIAHLTSRIDFISRTLQKHFEDYKVFLEYSRMSDSVIHHDFKEALQYDIQKLSELKEGDSFDSTVIFKPDYIGSIKNYELLGQYIRALMEASRRKAKLRRVFLTEAELLPEQKEHLQMLHVSGIDIRLLAESNLKEVATITRDLSNNFVIINNKEVAFAYPFCGEFRFAVNIIKTDDRESDRYFRDYQNLFDEMCSRSIKWSPTGCA